MPIIETNSQDREHLPCKLISYMFYPKDAKLRQDSYISLKTESNLASIWKNQEYVQINVKEIIHLLESKSRDDLHQKEMGVIKDAVSIKLIASNLLFTRKNPSLSKARIDTQELAISCWKIGLHIPKSESHLKKVWKKYRSVAHFWMAEFMIGSSVNSNSVATTISGRYDLFIAISHIILMLLLNIENNKHTTSESDGFFSLEDSWYIPRSEIPDKTMKTAMFLTDKFFKNFQKNKGKSIKPS